MKIDRLRRLRWQYEHIEDVLLRCLFSHDRAAWRELHGWHLWRWLAWALPAGVGLLTAALVATWRGEK